MRKRIIWMWERWAWHADDEQTGRTGYWILIDWLIYTHVFIYSPRRTLLNEVLRKEESALWRLGRFQILKHIWRFSVHINKELLVHTFVVWLKTRVQGLASRKIWCCVSQESQAGCGDGISTRGNVEKYTTCCFPDLFLPWGHRWFWMSHWPPGEAVSQMLQITDSFNGHLQS